MFDFTNAFTSYDGISLIPHNLTPFVILPINFIVTLSNNKNREIYTLSKLTLTSSSFTLLSSFMHITLTFQYQYSQKDLCHTLHTSYSTYQLIFAWRYATKPTTLYIQDLFAYSLSPQQIYTALLVIISS